MSPRTDSRRGGFIRWLSTWSAVLLCACAHQASAPVVPPPDAAETGLAVRCAMGGADADEDGLADSCELDFARAFAPMMVTASEGCNWDTSVEPARLGGEYLFAVQEMAINHVRIAYLPAYYRDCGWRGIKCWLPFVDCAPHDGDSEAVIIDVVRGSTPRSFGWPKDARRTTLPGPHATQVTPRSTPAIATRRCIASRFVAACRTSDPGPGPAAHRRMLQCRGSGFAERGPGPWRMALADSASGTW